MKFSYLSSKAKAVIIALFLSTAIFLIFAVYTLPFMQPDNDNIDLIVQWRLIFITVYIALDFCTLCFLGVIGAGYIINRSGIDYKKFFKSTFIPWEAIDKIEMRQDDNPYLRIFILDNNYTYNLSSKKIFFLRYTEDLVNEIEKYYDVINDYAN